MSGGTSGDPQWMLLLIFVVKSFTQLHSDLFQGCGYIFSIVISGGTSAHPLLLKRVVLDLNKMLGVMSVFCKGILAHQFRYLVAELIIMVTKGTRRCPSSTAVQYQ